jgi:hypothetical protein
MSVFDCTAEYEFWLFIIQTVIRTPVYTNNFSTKIEVNQCLKQGCTNPGHQVARTTEFCTLAPNICVSSEWNLSHVTLLALGLQMDPGKLCVWTWNAKSQVLEIF